MSTAKDLKSIALLYFTPPPLRSDIDITAARLLFDQNLLNVKNLDSQGKYITTDCDIAKNPQFESSVIKIFNDEEMTMSVGEGLACRMLRKNHIPEDDDVILAETDFASTILANRSKKQKKYMNVKFLVPTSNHLERFFSSAGMAKCDLRGNLSPMRLEQQLFLKYKKSFWNLQTVNDVVNAYE